MKNVIEIPPEFIERYNIERAKVKTLGQAIGYGHIMETASKLWREYLKETGAPEEGAFVPVIITKDGKVIADQYIIPQSTEDYGTEVAKAVTNLNIDLEWNDGVDVTLEGMPNRIKDIVASAKKLVELLKK